MRETTVTRAWGVKPVKESTDFYIYKKQVLTEFYKLLKAPNRLYLESPRYKFGADCLVYIGHYVNVVRRIMVYICIIIINVCPIRSKVMHITYPGHTVGVVPPRRRLNFQNRREQSSSQP